MLYMISLPSSSEYLRFKRIDLRRIEHFLKKSRSMVYIFSKANTPKVSERTRCEGRSQQTR